MEGTRVRRYTTITKFLIFWPTRGWLCRTRLIFHWSPRCQLSLDTYIPGGTSGWYDTSLIRQGVWATRENSIRNVEHNVFLKILRGRCLSRLLYGVSGSYHLDQQFGVHLSVCGHPVATRKVEWGFFFNDTPWACLSLAAARVSDGICGLGVSSDLMIERVGERGRIYECIWAIPVLLFHE